MGRRTRLSAGIYQDKYGISVCAKVRGVGQREIRFPRGTSLRELEPHRQRLRLELLEQRAHHDQTDEPLPVRGTFADDAIRYLARITGRVSYKADRSHLRAWLPLVGPLKRSLIRTSHVRAAVQSWTAKSPRTVRHRLRVFRELYQALDGAHAHPPLAGIDLPKVPPPHPTPVPLALIRKVAKSLKAGKRHDGGFGSDAVKGYARFLVRATTGQRPSQIMRAVRADVDLRRRLWFVRAGKGGDTIPLPLNREMLTAWKAFITAKAWGTFDVNSFAKLLRRHGWPKGIRPYTLRHTFAIDHLLKGTSLGDLQGLLGHRQIDTTRAHYAPIQVALLRKATNRRTLGI